MEKMDPQMAARVWQRVRGNGEETVNVRTVIAWEKEIESVLQYLNRRLPEKGYGLQQMISDTRRHIACLQGIRQLSGEKGGNYVAKPVSGEPGSLLRKCYGQSLRVGAWYAGQTENTQYGVVFGDMARTKRRHCATILEMLGSM